MLTIMPFVRILDKFSQTIYCIFSSVVAMKVARTFFIRVVIIQKGGVGSTTGIKKIEFFTIRINYRRPPPLASP